MKTKREANKTESTITYIVINCVFISHGPTLQGSLKVSFLPIMLSEVKVYLKIPDRDISTYEVATYKQKSSLIL